MRHCARYFLYLMPIAAVALLAFGALPAVAQSGTVVEVTQPARLVVNGERLSLAVGDLVNVGDTVLTGKGAKALLLFPDETKIVVGPSSQLKIERLLFRNETTARRFAVTAAKGTFRFLSGESPSGAYSVRTPVATMGVRGTVFDFAVPTVENTDLVVHDGLVQFCRRGNPSCAEVPRGCQTVRLQRQLLTQPETQADRREILNESFPFALQQNALRQEFRTATNDCDGDSSSVRVTQIQLPSENPVVLRDSPEPDQGGGNPAE